MNIRAKERYRNDPAKYRSVSASFRNANPDKVKETQRKWREANPDQVKENNRKYYAENTEREKLRVREYRAANPEKAKQSNLNWRTNNKERFVAIKKIWNTNNKEHNSVIRKLHYERNGEHSREVSREWKRLNPHMVVAANARRRASQIQAIPDWANFGAINSIYDSCKALNLAFGAKKWHVDHIVPLQSDSVCGLHCEANLQIIPAEENQSKRNRYWPDMW